MTTRFETRLTVLMLSLLTAACEDTGGGGEATTTDGTMDTSATATATGGTTSGSSSSAGASSSDAGSSSSNAGSSSSDGGSSSSDDGLQNGCWDHDFMGSDADGPFEPPWEAFTCGSLPTPCGDVALAVISGADGLVIDEAAMTPEEIAAADADLRCALQGLRDGTPGRYALSWNIDEGVGGNIAMAYFVLADGVVASGHAQQDLVLYAFEAYRSADAAVVDACLAEVELLDAARCLVPPIVKSPLGFVHAPVLDADACIDAAPVCPG